MFQNVGQDDFLNSIMPGTHGGAVTGDAIKMTGSLSRMAIITIGAALANDVTFTFEHTGEDPAAPGTPNAAGWTDIVIVPECDDPTGTLATGLKYEAKTGNTDLVCELALPSQAPFVRAKSSAGGSYAVVIRRARKTRR